MRCVALCALGLLAATAARAETPAAAVVDGPAGGMTVGLVSKKDAYLMAKQRAVGVRARPEVGASARKVVNLYNTWTHEWLAIDARRPTVTRAEADRFLRCHFTGAPATMDPRLLPTLVAAATHFGVDRVDIVSGFRSPKYNLNLRKKGRQVARDSQHTHGTAVDFRLPGVRLEALHAWAVARKLGGVGRYRGSGFVHMDTDRIRFWDGE